MSSSLYTFITGADNILCDASTYTCRGGMMMVHGDSRFMAPDCTQQTIYAYIRASSHIKTHKHTRKTWSTVALDRTVTTCCVRNNSDNCLHTNTSRHSLGSNDGIVVCVSVYVYVWVEYYFYKKSCRCLPVYKPIVFLCVSPLSFCV